MSQENVESSYRALDAFNRRDIEAFLSLVDEDVEISSRLAPLAEGGYRGHDGVRLWFQNLWDAFPDVRSEPVEMRDLGEMTLFAVRFRGHGGQSGAPIDQTIWQLAEFREGKCILLHSYDAETDALEAAGLAE